MIPADLDFLSTTLQWLLMYLWKKWKSFPKSEDRFKIDLFHETHLTDSFPHDLFLNGTITQIVGDTAVIDGNFNFRASSISYDVHIGNVVSFILTSERQVTSVRVISHINNLSEPDHPEKHNGLVAKQIGTKYIISPGPVEFDIRYVYAEFKPEVGDLIDFKMEEDRLRGYSRVTHIYPVGYNTARGTITFYQDNVGYINDMVKFELHHCMPEYLPAIGDDVYFSAIKCRDADLNYRTVHLSPYLTISKLKWLDTVFDDLVFKPRDIVKVTINRDECILTSISNNTTSDFKLLNIKVHSEKSVNVEIIEPENLVMTLKRGLTYYFKLKITTKVIGFTRINFQYQLMGREFKAEMTVIAVSESLDATQRNPLPSQKKSKPANLGEMVSLRGKAIPGQRFFKPCNFVPVKLGRHEIPPEILEKFKTYGNRPNFNQLKSIFPCLVHSTGYSYLQRTNYMVFWHSLLYIEEINIMQDVANLSLESGFHIRQDFLVLYIDEDSKISTMLNAGDNAYVKSPNCEQIFQGVIWSVSRSELLLKFASNFHNRYVEHTICEISFVVGRSMFQRKHQGVNDAYHYLGLDWLFPTEVTDLIPYVIPVYYKSQAESPVAPRKVLRTYNRRGSGYGHNQTNFKLKNELPVGVKKYIQWYNVDINEEQKTAVINILQGVSRPLPYVIFGPPGTGKSVTVVESILQIYNNIPNSRLIVCASTNSAVDLLSLCLIGSGFIKDDDLLRIFSRTYASKPDNINVSLMKFSGMYDYGQYDPTSQSYKACTEIPKVDRNTISNKRIILSTLGCIAPLQSMGFPRGYFTHFIIDEAAQISEPECLIVTGLMSKSAVLVLAGDPMQLGPYAYSKHSARFGYSQSFLMRMMRSPPYMNDKQKFPETLGFNPKLITKLIKSYRSVPPLVFLPNILFYNGELQAMLSVEHGEKAATLRSLAPILPSGCQIPLLFHSVSGTEELSGSSFFNIAEAFLVASYLVRVYSCGVTAFDVGVITPYLAQKKEIEKYLRDLNLDAPKIGSVEEFQGQERKVIILSLVRSSYSCDENCFIFQRERINVAITRAEVFLVIIGKSDVLLTDQCWNRILLHCKNNNSLIEAGKF